MVDDEEKALWAKAFQDAKKDELAAQKRLTEIKSKQRALTAEREQAKQDLRDAIKAVKTAAYALKTGKRPK